MSAVSTDTMRVVWAALNRTGKARAAAAWTFNPDIMARAATLADNAAAAAAAGDADTARAFAHDALTLAADTEHARGLAF